MVRYCQMSITPLVSVVMATYNRADAIGRAIDSILNQTYDNFELLIVDDGCTDGTSLILEKYAAKDKRIVLLKQNNLGLAAARNAAVDKAQGKYIAFMDDDDISLPNRLEKQVAFLEKYPDFSLCRGRIQVINLEGKPLSHDRNLFYKREYYPLAQDPYKNKQHSEYILGPSICLTRESFIDFNGYRLEGHLIIEDLDFTLRFLRKYKGASMLGEPLYLYTDSEVNFGSNLTTKDCINFLKRHVACYISTWFDGHNMPDPVKEDLKLDEIISLITKLPKSDRCLIHKSVIYMMPSIMRTKKISRKKAEEFISSITHISRHEFFRYRLLLKLRNSILLKS